MMPLKPDQLVTERIEELEAVACLARDNIASLMNAYPDRFPRHAFQGTYDALCEVVGSPAQVPMFAHNARERE